VKRSAHRRAGGKKEQGQHREKDPPGKDAYEMPSHLKNKKKRRPQGGKSASARGNKR